ncbi:hydroxypyruvate isomerase family protein [Pseudomonas fluorescens]|uniref:2-oxo-tetronate isomerase n=1 Tax=Pseudomonas fluorescens TaxID=294 RepID=A0A5E7A4S5_PSEFL|nr:TIM barrel protein [Pseudomonas fluorescens]VVN71421.1 2-oxo-tetronate isomerase [Pseudomonas fluorescens]
MIKYAANLTLLFTEWPFEDRFSAARDAGFEAIEFSFPRDMAAAEIAENLRRTGLQQVLATVPLQPGSKGLAAQSRKAGNFRKDFNLGLEYAVEGGSPLLHVLSGLVEQSNYAVASGQFVDNMNWAIEEAARHDVKVVIEAINQISVPGYFIRTLAGAVSWTQRLEGLGLILDLYHASMERLDPLICLERYLPQADHLQIAGYPGRHEPNVGDLNLPRILDSINTHPYMGWVGCEYQPVIGTLEGMSWLDRFVAI